MPDIIVTPQIIQVTVSQTGTQGSSGIQGPAGIQGPTGPIGITGATGIQGPIGISGIAGASGSLSLMSDVTITGPINYQFLKYNGSKWTNVNTEIVDGGNF